MKVLGFGGSLRKGSFNSALLHAAVELSPENIDLELFEQIGEFPLFNQDHENNPPHLVQEFKEKVKKADAILISTPEYNYSVPGFLKNAIDWASRPYGNNSFEGKAVGIMSASGGMLGGSRAQYHLRQTFIFLEMYPLNRPEIMVSFAADKIKNGKVTDEHTREKIKEMLVSLGDLALRLQKK